MSETQNKAEEQATMEIKNPVPSSQESTDVNEIAKQVVVNVLEKAVDALKTQNDSEQEQQKKSFRFGTSNLLPIEDKFIDHVVRCTIVDTKQKVYLADDFNFVEHPIDAEGFVKYVDAKSYIAKVEERYADKYKDFEVFMRTRTCTIHEIGIGE